MSNNITTMHSTVRVKPYIRRVSDGIIPGASVRISKANAFVPYEQLRDVADALHDMADEYEVAEQDGWASVLEAME